ncbi:MAG: amidohydrolase family protein [Victivallales bacterium]
MREPFIIDAHIHTGTSWMYYSPEPDWESIIELMDKLAIKYAICSETVFDVARRKIEKTVENFERSDRRIFYLGVYDPADGDKCLETVAPLVGERVFLGLKLHPSLHKTAPEDEAYDRAWRFVADNNLTLLTHSWSVSDYNPVQAFSTPERFEGYVKKYPSVRFVLAHAGGRGTGREQAIRMANEYENVYLDFAGDIFCFEYIETMLKAVPAEKLIFGSDYPMLDPRANLSRVFLSNINSEDKQKILVDNAKKAYKLE